MRTCVDAQVEHTLAFELDVLDGTLKPRHGVKLFDGRPKDAFLLESFAAEETKRLAILDRDSTVNTSRQSLPMRLEARPDQPSFCRFTSSLLQPKPSKPLLHS
jgi:hypothetical protein